MLFPCTAGSAPPPEEDAGRAVLELPPVPEHAAKHRHRHKHKASERIKTKELVKYAVVVVSTVPALAIFPFVQKYFVKGVMVGAIKG